MRYQVTCLTPTLVGDGQKLSPIDYMVWKNQVNVLDQRRIFKLLAKGPRLDGYLSQVKKAEKLDFANWGGFAQNFAGRRIPFEHESMTAIWERQFAENLFIPTFATGPGGQYLPASALRGALHTAYLFSRWTEGMWKQVEEKMQGDRIPRRPAEAAEHAILGDSGHNRLRSFAIADSAPASPNSTLVYLVRTSTLIARGQGRLELGWKQAGRGSVDARRVEESTPLFCEMAVPGSSFTGIFSERRFFSQPEVLRSMRWREPLGPRALLAAANAYSAKVLQQHRAYAALAGLPHLESTVSQLEQALAEVGDSACILPIGWGGGFLSKVAFPDGMHEGFRKVLRQLPYYSRAIQSGLPFPKTRRVVFLNNQAASLPGWVRLDLELPEKQEPLSKQPVPVEEVSETPEQAL